MRAGKANEIRVQPAGNRRGRETIVCVPTYDILMAQMHDVDRFNRWAKTYDRHWMQRFLFGPVQATVLQLAEQAVERPAAILDVGCGTGLLLRSAAQRFPEAKLEGVDAAGEMVKQAMASGVGAAEVHFQQATAEALPFPDGRFDLVFSTVTFHHWHDQSRGVAEVARVLAPGGRWLLADFIATGAVVHIGRWLRLKHFPERQALDAMLGSAGLVVVAERHAPGLLSGRVSILAIGAKA